MKASRIMVKAPSMMAKAPRIMLEPPCIMAKAPRIMPKAPPYIMLKAPNKMLFDHFKPAMAFYKINKRRSKMKDDHIAYLPDRAAPRSKFTGTVMQCAK